MIFAIWYSLWILLASSALALVFPGLAITARTAYLNRRLVLSWVHLAVVIAIFLSLALSRNTLNYSATFALQYLGFVVLTGHLASGMKEIRTPRLPFDIPILWHLCNRYFGIVIERIFDIGYAVRIRSRSRDLTLTAKARFLLAASMSIVIELVVLVGRITMMINARGALPHPSLWKLNPRVRTAFALGDVALFAVIMVMVLLSPERLIPSPISKFIHELGDFVMRLSC